MYKTTEEKTYLRDYLMSIRLHHWPKNLLVFLPALTGHLITIDNFRLLSMLFISLSLVASGLYLMDDLVDIENDKNHPTKKYRAIARGSLSPMAAKIISLLLVTIGLISSFMVFFEAGLLILLYILLVCFYSLYLKKFPFFEAFLLTTVYLLRIYIGVLVIGTEISEWMLIFSFFFFFFLVLEKRYTELSLYLESSQKDPTGRGYEIKDLNLIQSLAASSALVSLLVFGLYISSPKVQALYSTPVYLWGIVLLGFAWVLNMIVLSNKGKMQDDPIVFAFTNKTSLGIFLFSLILVLFSI